MKDERGIVIAWLLKVVVSFALVGVVLFDLGAIGIAKVQVDGIAVEAASEASIEYSRSASTAKAEGVADAVVARRGGELIAFRVVPEDGVVRVTVRKVASTFVTHRVSSLRRFTLADSTHESSYD